MDHTKEMRTGTFYSLVSFWLLVGFVVIGVGDSVFGNFFQVNSVSLYVAVIVAAIVSVDSVILIRRKMTLTAAIIGYSGLCASVSMITPFIPLPIGTICVAMILVIILGLLLSKITTFSPWIAPLMASISIGTSAYLDRSDISSQILKQGWIMEVALYIVLGLLIGVVYWSCRKAKKTPVNAVIGAAGLLFLLQIYGLDKFNSSLNTTQD